MRQAYQGERTVVIRHDQQTHIAAVPLQVRGEVIGVLEIERGGDRPWTDDEIELIEVLVDRLSLAVENARLFEQATLVAEREQFVSRVGQEVQAAETIEEVLQTALSELSTVLGASRGIVQISPKAEDEYDDGAESEA
jgi:GAF domain-containing protein